MDARAFLAIARLDLGALLHQSIEGRGLLDQALTAAAELGMTSLAKRAAAAHTVEAGLHRHRRARPATSPTARQ